MQTQNISKNEIEQFSIQPFMIVLIITIGGREKVPTKKEIMQYYETEYSLLNPSLHIEDSEFKASEILSILRKMGIKKIDTLLFLGCGTGAISNELEKTIQTNFAVGCDISSSILKIAKNVNQHLILIKADCETVPIKNNSIDFVLLIDIIEHLKSPQQAIAEATRISKRWVLVRTPIDYCLYHNLRKDKDTWLSEWKMHCGHLWWFDLHILKTFLEQNRLNLILLHTSKTPFTLIKTNLFFRIIMFVLPRLIPGAIYRKLFPAEHLILAHK